jgi:hypothetical protein
MKLLIDCLCPDAYLGPKTWGIGIDRTSRKSVLEILADNCGFPDDLALMDQDRDHGLGIDCKKIG